ncbi:MAG: DegT/DnrJ/EryC1/StrS family aminotransferase [Gemmatimonadales bacterium]|jgi:dTDP-4-amino-4,6-dideoxygalactose transaminase
MIDRERVPVLDLGPELELLWDELSAEALRVIRSGRFVLGPDVEAFEAEAAEYLGVRHAVGMNSGTDALIIGLRALGVEPGDEVVTTPFTFFATAEAISLIGATPVFADIEPGSFNLDPAAAEAAVTDRTTAIIPVHLFGRPADHGAFAGLAERHGLRVLEDCAQAIGATVGGADGRDRKVGGLGDAGAFSFYPTKNLGGFGDGGLLTTDDDEVAQTARMLRTHGERSRYHNEMLGYNSRLDALQAALLRVKLSRLDEFNRGRRAAAQRYDELLADLQATGELTAPAVTDGHMFHQYTVRIHGGRRDAVREALDVAGVGTMVYYPIPVHRLPVYADAYAGVELPAAETAAAEVLSLPIWPAIEAATQERVAAALADALGRG